MTLNLALVAVVSLMFAGARIYGITDKVFKDFAHLWVGGLIGYWWCARSVSEIEIYRIGVDVGLMAIAISGVELAVFIIQYIKAHQS